MKKVLIILAVILGILLIIVFSIAGFVKKNYNAMVTMDEGINGAWAQVENVLQRRYDLIPNLVETVKG
ncbi:MAG TPA: LemA family protein, partial [bacterium]|nr:LemA family protein [bacterium]